MGEKKQFSSPSAYAGNRRGRKIAAIVGATTASALAIVVIVALLFTKKGAVTVINREGLGDTEMRKLVGLKVSPTGEEVEATEPGKFNNAWVSRAKDVVAWNDSLTDESFDEKGFATFIKQGHTVTKEADSQPYNYAAARRVYLDNKSTDKSVEYTVTVHTPEYEGYQNQISSYLFLRVIIEIEDESGTKGRYWYAAPPSDRESDGNFSLTHYLDPLRRYAVPGSVTPSQCENFQVGIFGTTSSTLLPADSVHKITVITFFDGDDSDGPSAVPQGETIQPFSITVSVTDVNKKAA